VSAAPTEASDAAPAERADDDRVVTAALRTPFFNGLFGVVYLGLVNHRGSMGILAGFRYSLSQSSRNCIVTHCGLTLRELIGLAPNDLQFAADTWPPSGPQRRPPTLEHIRDLWTLHWSQSNCTAAIWRNDFGLELRVLHGGELIESRLSRYGEAPLLLIADEVKANLLEQGWFETPQATEEK